MVGELASLKDRLSVIQKRAKHVSKENPGPDPQPEERVLVCEFSEEYREMMIRNWCEMMIRSWDLDYPFHDVEPMEKSFQYSMASAPIYREGGRSTE